MKKFIEPTKSVIIVFLIFSMLFLWTKNMQLHFLSDTASDDKVTLSPDFWIFTDTTNAPSKTVANPDYFSAASITLSAGEKTFTSATNKELTKSLWEQEFPLIKEVFSSSYVCEKSSFDQWNQALSGGSFILIDFPGALPYTLICAFDNKTSNFAQGEMCAVKNLLLYPDENNVVCALSHDGNNNFHSFKTTLDKTSALIYDFNSNNLAAYTVNKGFIDVSFNIDSTLSDMGVSLPIHHKILSSSPNLEPIHIENSVSSLFEKFYSSEKTSNLNLVSDENITSLLERFEINPSTVGVYTDANSRLIFINSATRLAAGKNGIIEYAVSAESEPSVTIASLLESERTQFASFEYLAAATAFLDLFKKDFIGEDTDLLLETVDYKNEKTTFTFGYYSNLCKVQSEENTAFAELVFDSKGLVEAVIAPLKITDAKSDLLTETALIKANVEEKLALSLVSGTKGAELTDFCPVYIYENHNKSVYPVWAAIGERK